MNRLPFWSDDFDMDLLKVLPDTEEILGRTAGVALYTYGHTSYDRLNHPAVWNDYAGTVAFFGTTPSGFKDDCYSPSSGLVECTFLEAVRDAWPHNYRLLINRQQVWDTERLMPLFDALMYHRRGWRRVADSEEQLLVGRLRKSLSAAVQRLIAVNPVEIVA